MQIDPYLTFNGNCEEAFEFYSKVLRIAIGHKMTYGESPESERCAGFKDKIMHIGIQIGSNHLMASDAQPNSNVAGNNNSVCLSPDSVEEAERIFAELSEGGKVEMPMMETFWAERFGMFTDKFGIPWMVNFSNKKDGQS